MRQIDFGFWLGLLAAVLAILCGWSIGQTAVGPYLARHNVTKTPIGTNESCPVPITLWF
jgi:hypothetical protein